MTFLADFRQAMRRLARAPALSIAIVLVLACAFGATTLVFSLANGVLLRPLPFREPDRLVSVHRILEEGLVATIPYRDYEAWRVRTGVLEDVAGASPAQHGVLFGNSQVPQAQTGWVTPNFFSVLGWRVLIGRVFGANEHQPGQGRTAILTEPFWRRHFGSDPAALGTPITVVGGLSEELRGDYVIVGVVAGSVRCHRPDCGQYEIFFPASSPPPMEFNPPTGISDFSPLVARLKPGVGRDHASEAVARFARELGNPPITTRGASQIPVFARPVVGGFVVPLHDAEVGWTRQGFAILATGAAFVLLTACVNVGMLLLATAMRRAPELAVRSSLGATQSRLLRDMLVEYALLGLAGAAAGTVVAIVAIPVALAVAPTNLPRTDAVAVDGTVLTFTAIVAVASGLVFGLLPAAIMSRRAHWPKRVSPPSQGRRGRRARELLAAVQLILTVALLIQTLLAVRSFWKLATVPLGFEPSGVVATDLALARRAQTESAGPDIQDRLLREAKLLPGVTSAALTLNLPGRGEHRAGIVIPGVEGNSKSGYLFVESRLIAGDYFDVFRITVRRGRALGVLDRDTGAVVVNESFARRYFPGRDPLGQRIFVAGWRDVVGVVADAREQSAERPAEPTFYDARTGGVGRLWLAVRSSESAAKVQPDLQRLVERVDRKIAGRLTTLEAELATGRAPARFYAVVLGTFGFFALLLAATGVFTLSR